MHTCISSHGLKRSWRSCPRRVNAGNKNTRSTHHPRRRNVTTLMVGLKNGHIRKNLTQSGEPQRHSWGTHQKKKKKKKERRGKTNTSQLYIRIMNVHPIGQVHLLDTLLILLGRIGVVGWLLYVLATCWCISGTDLLRQFYVLPHWDRSSRSNFPSHPVPVY